MASKAKKSHGGNGADVTVPSEVEFFSSDLAKANKFFRDSFGWDVQDMPEWKMGFAKWGTPLTGMVRVKDDKLNEIFQTATLYFTVPDFDKEVKRLTKFGAKTFTEKNVIPNMGSWGYIQVPGDLILGLWSNDPSYTPKPKPNDKKPGEEPTVNFFEFVTSEPEEAQAFLKKAFGWGFDPTPFGDEKYWYFPGDHKTFSVGLRLPEKQEKGSNILPFVNVSSLDDTTKTTLKNGAKKFFPKPRPYGEFGTAGYVNTPGSVVLGLWESNPGHHGGKEGDGEGEGEKEESSVAEKPAKKQGVKRGRGAAAAAKTAKKPAKRSRKD